jgi:hypothetical protein
MFDVHESQDDCRHEPRQAFVDQLEELVRAAEQKARLPANGPQPLSRRLLLLAAGIIAIVSAALGGSAVVVAYQVQRTDLRQRLVATYEERVALEEQRLALTRETLRDRESRSARGIENEDALLELRSRLTEVATAVQLVQLKLSEVRLTSQEPVMSASAPLVSGRDFVTERWQLERTVPQAALEKERSRLQAAKTRFDVGMGKVGDVEQAGLRVIEIEEAIEAIGRKLSIRQAFLKGLLSPAMADLRVLEAEAERQSRTLVRRIELANQQLKDLQTKVEIGTLPAIEFSAARLRVQELQLDLTKAAYDLELIRDQIRRRKE